MQPKPRYLSDLVEFDKLRVAPFLEAFETACPTTARWSDEGGLSRRQITNAVLSQLPIALNKGLHELAQARSGRFGYDSHAAKLTFAWSAFLDVLIEGEEQRDLALRVDCAARADRIEVVDGINAESDLVLGDAEWEITTTLSIAEGADGRGAQFYERSGLAMLPLQL